MPVKSKDVATRKFRSGVQGAGQAYQEGVKAAPDWEASYKAGIPRMEQGVQRAIAEGKMAKGAAKAGDKKWRARAGDVGAQRFTGAAGQAAAGYEAVYDEVATVAQAAQDAAGALPNATLEDRLRRAREANVAAHRKRAQQKGVAPEI